jgi:hypothetical protein
MMSGQPRQPRPAAVLAELASLRVDWDVNARERERLYERITAQAVTALQLGVAPGDVYRIVPFSGTTVRTWARIAGVPPGAPGIKPADRRPPRS